MLYFLYWHDKTPDISIAPSSAWCSSPGENEKSLYLPQANARHYCAHTGYRVAGSKSRSCLYSCWDAGAEFAFASTTTSASGFAGFGGLFAFGGRPLRLFASGSSDARWDIAACSCLPFWVNWPVISSSLSLPMTELTLLALPVGGWSSSSEMLPHGAMATAALALHSESFSDLLALATVRSSMHDIAWHLLYHWHRTHEWTSKTWYIGR